MHFSPAALLITLAAAAVATPSRAGTVDAAAGFESAPANNPITAAPAAVPILAPAPVALAAPAQSPSPLPASALIPIDPESLPATGKHYTPSEWDKLVAATPGGGAREILKSMSQAPSSSPQVRITLADGEQLDGRFRGLNGNKMIFESAGKLVGLDRNSLDVSQVRRLVDVLFDGAEPRPAEVVVHDRPAVVDPFKDLAAYKGRVVDMDVRDLDDLKWSLHAVSGRVIKADGESVELKGPKGVARVRREFHRIDSVALRTEQYASRDQITTIADVNDNVPLGTPVELILTGGKSVSGLFRGVRKDAQGSFAVIETPDGNFRGYRDFFDLRTTGHGAGGLLPDAETLYTRPEK